MASDVLGNIILTVYSYPQLIQNKTLTEVLTTVASNATVLNYVAQLSGIKNSTIEDAIWIFLTVLENLPTPVPKVSTNSSNVTSNNAQCTPTGEGDFTSLSLIPAFFIIFLLSFLAKRQHPKKWCGVLWNRPGLCIPLNLVDSYENRIAYACAFGATVSKCLAILFFADYSQTFSQDLVKVQQDPNNPRWIGAFWKMLAMVFIGVSYYPLFACISTEYKLLGGIIGFFYSGLWLFMTFAYDFECPYFAISYVYPGDSFAFALPVYVCLIVLLCMYFIIVVKGLMKFHRRRLATQVESDEVEEWKNSYKYKYVVRLLKAIPKECREQNIIGKVKSKIYKWKPGFKYSTRVFCTYVVCLLTVYQAGVLLVMLGGLFYIYVIQLSSKYKLELFVLLGINQSVSQYWAYIGYVAWFVALAISSIHCLIMIANMLSWYRGHLARLQRGDKSFLPVQVLEKSPASITAATLKYSGYQVAYVVWNYVFLNILLFVIGTIMGIEIVVPMIRGTFDSFLWKELKNFLPALLVSLVIFGCQYFLAKFAFLYQRGSALALDNRRVFHICTYFLFFFNLFLGVISCLKRIIIGTILGIIFLGRLQKSLLPRDFELKDPGFNAYIGYLYLEHTHSNPVLVTFCRMLLLGLGEQNITPPIGYDREAQSINLISERWRKRIRNRWALLMTLTNNPSLIQERRQDKFAQKSPLKALGVLANDFSLLAAEHSRKNYVQCDDESALEDGLSFQHEEQQQKTSKL